MTQNADTEKKKQEEGYGNRDACAVTCKLYPAL